MPLTSGIMPADDVVAKKRKRLEWQKMFALKLDRMWFGQHVSKDVRPLKRKKCRSLPTIGKSDQCVAAKVVSTSEQNQQARVERQNDVTEVKNIQDSISHTPNSLNRKRCVHVKNVYNMESADQPTNAYTIQQIIIIDTAGSEVTHKKAKIWIMKLQDLYGHDSPVHLLSDLPNEPQADKEPHRIKADKATVIVSSLASRTLTLHYCDKKVPEWYGAISRSNDILTVSTKFLKDFLLPQSRKNSGDNAIGNMAQFPRYIVYDEAFRSNFGLRSDSQDLAEQPGTTARDNYTPITRIGGEVKDSNLIIKLDHQYNEKYNLPNRRNADLLGKQYINLKLDSIKQSTKNLPFCIAYVLGENSHIQSSEEKKRILRLYRNRHKLSCQFKNIEDVINDKHKYLTEKLEKLADIYELKNGMNDVYRAQGFRRAAKILKHCPDRFNDGKLTARTLDQIYREIRGFGKKNLIECKQILMTGRSLRLEVLEQDSKLDGLRELVKVYGIGTKTARALYDKGFRSVEQLRQGARQGKIKLTHGMKIGVKYFEDLKQKIPRSEVTAIKDYVLKTAIAVSPGKFVLNN